MAKGWYGSERTFGNRAASTSFLPMPPPTTPGPVDRIAVLVLAALLFLLPLLHTTGIADPFGLPKEIATVAAALILLNRPFGFVAMLGVIARARSKIQPVTATRIGAELHPNTLAVEQAAKQVPPADPAPKS